MNEEMGYSDMEAADENQEDFFSEEEGFEGEEGTDWGDSEQEDYSDYSGSEESEENESEEDEESYYTQEDIDRAIKSRLGRAEKEYSKTLRPYNELTNTLANAFGLDEGASAEDVNGFIRDIYNEYGIELPEYEEEEPLFTEEEELVLGEAYAEDVINAGDAEASYEDLMSREGELTLMEEAVKEGLENHLAITDAQAELNKMGADPEILVDDDFIDFASRYHKNMGLVDIYKDYKKFIIDPYRGNIETAGSARGRNDGAEDDFFRKGYYTAEEVDRIPDWAYGKYPDILDRIEKSMLRW